MFDKIKSFPIINKTIPFPLPEGFPAIKTGLRILENIYIEEEKDYLSTGFSRKGFIDSSFSLEDLDNLKLRFLSRITSYIIIICTVDGILRKSYHLLLSEFNKSNQTSLLPLYLGKRMLKQRKSEIKNYMFYRNKVFAHTAYDSPRNDSLSLQYSSVLYFSGNLFHMGENYLALGGGSLIVDKEEFPPELSIMKDHQSLIQHYDCWENMFVEILTMMNQYL